MKIQLGKCTQNLIEIEKQIIDFLNQIKYQGNIIEKLRQIKYLKDQCTIETSTDLKSVLAENNSVIFESKPVYPLKLSIEFLQTDEEVFLSIVKIAKRINSGIRFKRPVAEKISGEYLDSQTEEEILTNLKRMKKLNMQ